MCYLIKNNVPFDVAMSLDDAERSAFLIAMAEIDGGKFNAQTMTWEEQK